jgi:hypothetical protein
MVHDGLKVDRQVLRNKFDLHQRTCLCDTHVSLVPVCTKSPLRQYHTSESPLWTGAANVPKYVIRHDPRDVALSGHRRDSIITGAHEILGARSPIVSYVHKRSTRTRNQRRLSSWGSVCRTDYHGDFSTLLGDKPHLGPWVSGLIAFNTLHESANTL